MSCNLSSFKGVVQGTIKGKIIIRVINRDARSLDVGSYAHADTTPNFDGVSVGFRKL